MENSDIPNILRDLESGRAKTRGKAVNDLTSMLKENPGVIPTKFLGCIAETFVSLIGVEYERYCSLLEKPDMGPLNKISAQESKFSTLAYVVRIFVEKTCSRFKWKTVTLLLHSCLMFISERGSNHVGKLLHPISIHFSYAILALLRCQLFRLKYGSATWVDPTKTICSILEERFKICTNDRTVSNLLECLDELVSLDTVLLSDVSLDIYRVISKYLRSTLKETVNTRLVLSLVNRFIARCHTYNVNRCIDLISAVWDHALVIGFALSNDIQRELSYCDIFASELVVNHLPLMVGQRPRGDTISSTLQEYMARRLVNFKSTNLTLDQLQFSEKRKRKIEWFEFYNFQLMKLSDPHDWFNLLAVVKLMRTYYSLIKPKEKFLSGPPFKRRKPQSLIEELLLSSSKPEEFICHALEQRESGLSLLALQILAFDNSNYMCDVSYHNRLKELVLQEFGNVSLTGWTCLCLISLISQKDFILAEYDLNRIFKICLPLVKVSEWCSLSCRLLATAMKYSEHRVMDSSTLNQIHDLYELSPINGPYMACNDSFIFWKYLESYGQELQFRKPGTTFTCLLGWLNQKWDQLLSLSDHENELYSFIAWMSNRPVQSEDNAVVDSSVTYSKYNWDYGLWREHYSHWTQYREERAFLLLNGISYRCSKGKMEENNIAIIGADRIGLQKLFDRLLRTLEDNHYPMCPIRFRWLIQIMKLINCLAGDPSFFPFVEDFRSSVSLFLHSLDYDDRASCLVFFQQVASLRLPNINHLIFSELNAQDMMVHFHSILGRRIDMPRNSEADFTHLFSSGMSSFYCYDVQIFVEALLCVLQAQNEPMDRSFRILLDFLDELKTEFFVECLHPIMTFLENTSRYGNLDPTLLERFTRLLSEHLLNKEFRTSNLTVYWMSSYLHSIIPYWLSNRGTTLNSDCNDILDWIISRFEDHSFSGAAAICRLSQLLLNMLKFRDSSRICVDGGKQKMFATFIECLKRLDKATVLTQLPEIIQYMSLVSYKNQKTIFSEIRGLFEPEQQSVEYSAFYTLAMLRFSLLSYSNLVLTLENMIVSARFEHTRSYIVVALNKITKDLKLPSVKYLFGLCKFELFYYWFSLDRSILKVSNSDIHPGEWDIALFGFENLEEFEKTYSSELVAFLFCRRPQDLSLMKEIKDITGKSDQQLLMNSYYMIVPLSYITQEPENLRIGEEILNDPNDSYNHLLIYRWVLQYCDFGSLKDTSLILNKLFPVCGFLQDLFSADSLSHTSRYLSPLHITLECWSQHLLSSYGRSFSAGELHFLFLWILADLEASKFNETRLNCIRQIKFIVVSHTNDFSNGGLFSNIVKKLAQLLGDTELHHEVLQLIICFIKLFDLRDLLITDVLSSIYSEIFKIMRDPHRRIHDSFKTLSKSIVSYSIPFSTTWRFCDEIVQGMIPGDEIFQNDELLKTEDCSMDKVILLSLMFSYARAPDICQLTLRPTDLAVINLLKYEIPQEFISNNMELWTAYYFDASGSAGKIGEQLRKASLIEQNMSFRDLFNAPGSLSFLFAEFFHFLDNNLMEESCRVQFLWESVLTCFLNDYNDLPEGTVRLDYTNHEKYKHRRVGMNRDLFEVLHGKIDSIQDLEGFIMHHFLSCTISYDEWLLEFAGSLLKELSFVLPDIMIFYHLCYMSRRFCENVLTILFNLTIMHNPRKGIDWAVRVVSGMDKLLETEHAAAKARSVLQIVSMLRSGSRLNERHCTLAYASLPVKKACDIALKTGQITFSYMLFEEFSTNDIETVDTVTLCAIYESLGDVDLLAGLPAPHTLIGALDSINKVDRGTWKSFLINNANFNVNYGSQITSDRLSLLNATESMGFYGLASFLGERDYSSQNNDPYKWALQLGSWDLPIPERIDTKEKGLYYSLKRVLHDDIEPFKSLGQSLVALVQKKKNFYFQSEWADMISNVSLLQRLAADLEKDTNVLPKLKDLISLDAEKLKFFDFEDYKYSLQCRHLLLSIISERAYKARHDCFFDISVVTAILLANDVRYSIENKSAQDSLRYAFLIENLLKSVRKLDSYSLVLPSLERLGLFVSAEALWECKEYKTPIRILEDLLHNEIYRGLNEKVEKMKDLFEVPDDYIQAVLVKWISESRLETPSAIFDKYIKNFEARVRDHSMRAKMFYILGNFLNEQVQRLHGSREIEERQHHCEQQVNESNALEMIFRNASLSENERKDAKRHHMKVDIQLKNDMELLTNLKSQRVQFVSKALHYYLSTLIFTNELDDDVLDKFCGLWFEYDGFDEVNNLLLKEISSVPSWKFLPWVNQIASKLSTEQTTFQRPLQLTLKRLLFKLPYDSLYSIMSILFYDKQSANTDQRISQKVQAAENLLKELQGFEKGNYYKSYVIPIRHFCEMSVGLANTKVDLASKSSKKLYLAHSPLGQYWLKALPNEKLPLPTMHFPIRSSSDGKASRPYIASTIDTIDISSTGISLPKIMTFRISNGLKCKVLIKGSNDDLRQDAIMEQVFSQVNKILQKDKHMRKLDLNISTYKVIPLGPNAGIIEYVAQSISLNQILVVFHKYDDISFDQARKKMKAVQNKSKNERIKTYNKLTESIKPVLRNFFFDYFPEPRDWLNAKKTYTKGIAASSIVGHILGLGDRHLNNILLDYSTGKPIHIDLGVAFDQGRLLPIPELVPFRLTRDVVDGFGVTGVDGLFRRGCESTYSVLRENYAKVMCVLNILKWDPLYSWVMSPIRRHRHLLEEDSQIFSGINLDNGNSALKSKGNQESYRALKGVEEKLIGNGLSVEATIQELIQQATNVENLALIYMGWSPFY